MDRDQLANALGGSGAGIRGSFDRTDIPAHHDGDIAATDVLRANQHHVGGLDHGIRGFNGGYQAVSFNHSKGNIRNILCHFLLFLFYLESSDKGEEAGKSH
jgi:hypothetical protein